MGAPDEQDPHVGRASTRSRRARFVFHSYHFPPIGGSGAQRPLKMARYLREFGYEPVVVTGGGATSDRWAPEDESLAHEVPADLEVHRLPREEEPAEDGRWRGRRDRWLGLESRWSRWWVDETTRLGADVGRDVGFIYVWMQPYASARAGARLSRTLGRPWIADLGDPWALDEMRVYPSALHRARDARTMRTLLGTASAIVMSTPEAARRMTDAFPELPAARVHSIPNGFDATDFDAAVPARADDKFRIVHTGYLHTELGLELRQTALARRLLRGSVSGLDILTRSHVFLVEAIDRLLRVDPSAASVLELHLAGVMSDADREVAGRCSVANVHGYVSHARSIELMRSADLLFLPMHELPPGRRATIVPGKTYEYLASETPILAAVPEGDARDLLEESGVATLCRPSDVEAIARALGHHLEAFRAGRPPARPKRAVVERYEYRRLARELAGVFDAVVDDAR